MASALDLAQTLSRYQPNTQNTIRRSQYLQDAIEQIGQPQKDPQSLGEALSRVAQAYVLKRGSDKSNTALAEALRGERQTQDAAALQGLEMPVPQAPTPQAPAPAPQMTPQATAPQAQAPSQTAAMLNPANRSNGTSPIGIRQNNPGNIRDTSIPWQGATGAQGGFENFDTPENGIRALARNLMTYGKKGLDTPAEIIGRWAPPSENNTGAYVQAVSQALGTDPNGQLNMQDPQTLAKLAGAIIQHENGQNPYSPEMLSGGVSAAMGQQPQAQQIAMPPYAQQSAPQQPAPPPQQPMPQVPAQQAPQGQQMGRVTPDEIALAKRMIADPNMRQQGLAFAMELQKKNATPPKTETVMVNGVPYARDPSNPNGQLTPLAVPQEAMNQTVSAQQAGINAPEGTTFSRSPTGKLDPVYAPPAGYERTQGGVRYERGSAADPAAGGNLVEGEGRLRAEYGKAVADYTEARNSFAKVVQAAKDGTPASDIALIFNVMKTFDPGSTVREGEFATAQNSGSVPENLLAAYNKALSGDRLLPEKRQEFVNTASGQFRVYEDRAKQANQRYGDIAKSYGYDPSRVVSPVTPVDGMANQPPSASPQAPPVQGARRGQDGGWYVQDPNNKGSFPRLEQGPGGGWRIRSNGKLLEWK